MTQVVHQGKQYRQKVIHNNTYEHYMTSLDWNI